MDLLRHRLVGRRWHSELERNAECPISRCVFVDQVAALPAENQAGEGAARPCSTANMGLSSANHHSVNSPISSAEPRSRNRVWGSSFGMPSDAHPQNAGHPVPEHHHGVQHDQALPQKRKILTT